MEIEGPQRFNNHDFMTEFHQLFHTGNAEKYKQRRDPRPMVASSGMDSLQLAMLEDWIREFVIDTIKTKEIHSKKNILNDHQLKNVIKTEVGKRLKGFEQLKQDMRSSIRRDSTSTIAWFDQNESQPEPKSVIQAHLLDGIHEAIAIETLGCRPIEGKDIPVKKTGFGVRGELIMVEELNENDTR